MSILERLLRHPERPRTMTTATNGGTNGGRPGIASAAQASVHGSTPDLLPMNLLPAADERAGRGTRCGIVVALTGDELDHELMALACTVAREKHVTVVHAMYGIAVPRTKAVNADMPAERRAAEAALQRAVEDARPFHITVEKEYLQSRCVGASLVHAATAHACALLILGLPSSAETEDATEISETLAHVLAQAPFRLWVVRGQSVPATAPAA
jgi:hypothetical protein